jgi:hypothetical protein
MRRQVRDRLELWTLGLFDALAWLAILKLLRLFW